MTNADFYEKKDAIADQIGIILRDCDCDKTKINDGLWSRLAQMYREVEDYL